MGIRGASLSGAPVLVGSRQSDMARGVERYPFQLRSSAGPMAWVLSGADVDRAC